MNKRTIDKEIKKAIKEKTVVVITGARQVGKTTLCIEKIKKSLDFHMLYHFIPTSYTKIDWLFSNNFFNMNKIK